LTIGQRPIARQAGRAGIVAGWTGRTELCSDGSGAADCHSESRAPAPPDRRSPHPVTPSWEPHSWCLTQINVPTTDELKVKERA
jgi:hypothetical protein